MYAGVAHADVDASIGFGRLGEESVHLLLDAHVGPNIPRFTASLADAAGMGLAFVFHSSAATDLAAGSLEEVLADWSSLFPAFYLYYPSATAARKQMPLKLRVFIEFLQSRL